MATGKTTENTTKDTAARADDGRVTADAYVRGGGGSEWSTKQWALLYVAIFVVVQVVIVFAFVGLGGEKRPQRKMLTAAETQFAEGNYQQSLDTLLAFGERWPGAYGTQQFEWKLGERYYALEKYRQAAEHYSKSAQADPERRDLRALTGRALWKAGSKQEAVRWFRKELDETNPESDIAHFYLGQAALENEQYIQAFGHFQAISDQEKYAEELARARKRLEAQVLLPSEAEAKKRAAADAG